MAGSIDHYENFRVASILCPANLRAPITAIYLFARTADDLADEGNASSEHRLRQLAAFRQALACPKEPSDWPQVFEPLHRVIASHRLPLQPLHDLLDAFVQDVEMTRDAAHYPDEAALMDYCRRSANPVGRLLLHLYGVTEDLALQESDAVCCALQLINFWQDLRVDIPRGRFYLPLDARRHWGVSDAELLALRESAELCGLVRESVAAARTLMLRGAPLVHRVPGRAGWELRLVVQGGLRILDKIASQGYSTLRQRPTLRWWDAPVLAWRAWRM